MLVLFAIVSDLDDLEIDDDSVVAGDEVIVDVDFDDDEVLIEVTGEEEATVPPDVSGELPAINAGVDS